jgi:phenylacetate-CoA ligase
MDHYDTLETRDPAERERSLFEALRAHVARAKETSPYYRISLEGVDPAALTGRTALAALPLLYKSQLIDLQAATPPFGGLTALEPGQMRRLFLSPGPIAEAQGRRTSHRSVDHWRMARALYAAGFRAGDVVFNGFSYHLTPAGFMLDEAAGALGCAVFPGGVGNVETQVTAITRLGINAYTGTPDFLKIIMERGEALGTPTSGIAKTLVTGGPLFPELRAWYLERGVAMRQCYGTAELGLIAYEAAEPADGMVVDEHCIVEIVRPGTGTPVPDGEVGEVVVTTFDDAYPMIRLATGDLSAVMPGMSPCGRTNMRLKGWMGRADQTTKVRGMFVHPRQVATIADRFPAVIRARLEVTQSGGLDELRLLCETAAPDPSLAEALKDAIRAECHLRGEVEFRAPGSLANDGKVIDDKRSLKI